MFGQVEDLAPFRLYVRLLYVLVLSSAVCEILPVWPPYDTKLLYAPLLLLSRYLMLSLTRFHEINVAGRKNPPFDFLVI